jgi:hypothetical protein
MEHFYRAQQNLSSLHKIGWRPAEKNLNIFIDMRILSLHFYDNNAGRSNWLKNRGVTPISQG